MDNLFLLYFELKSRFFFHIKKVSSSMCSFEKKKVEVEKGPSDFFSLLQILHFHASSAERRQFLYTMYCMGVKWV